MYPHLRLLTKGAIVSSLLIYYILKVPPQNKLYILALIAALAGDLFLAIQKGNFFMLGLSSFLVMQILYILIFKRGYSKPTGNKFWASIGIAVFYLGFAILSWSSLGDLQIPVLIYAFALLSMLYFAMNVRTGQFFNYFGWGALLFVISDLLLAINKFVSQLPYEHFLVMVTYSIAQLMICLGLILSYERSLKSSK
ncbi:MAG TPA: lysoplasmalogenase [Saprospiraceae bacterium]|nr:lysoplasmalogenase [Saprospiraceae bacterium]